MKFPVLWSGVCRYTEGWGGKGLEILATIKLLYNPRVNEVFTLLHFTCELRPVNCDLSPATCHLQKKPAARDKHFTSDLQTRADTQKFSLKKN